MSQSTKVAFTGVSKTFPKKNESLQVLDNIDLEVGEG